MCVWIGLDVKFERDEGAKCKAKKCEVPIRKSHVLGFSWKRRRRGQRFGVWTIKQNNLCLSLSLKKKKRAFTFYTPKSLYPFSSSHLSFSFHTTFSMSSLLHKFKYIFGPPTFHISTNDSYTLMFPHISPNIYICVYCLSTTTSSWIL